MAPIRSIVELHRIGYQTLVLALGPVDAARYVQRSDTGIGNYTEERKEFLSNDMPKVVSEILRNKQK